MEIFWFYSSEVHSFLFRSLFLETDGIILTVYFEQGKAVKFVKKRHRKISKGVFFL
jgi:hypothetical protein